MKNSPRQEHYDAVVVGARCAGASVALLLAQAGSRVLLVDKSDYGTDTLSTHAIMRGGILQLQRWGLLGRLTAAGTPAVRRTVFHYGADELPIEIKPSHGVDALYAPRRIVLDKILADAAVDAGAEVLFGFKLTNLRTARGGRVSGVELRDAAGNEHSIGAGLVIGADGRSSAVARLTGAEFTFRTTHFGGSIYGYFSGLPQDGSYHWHFDLGLSAGAIPTNNSEHCVFAGVPGHKFKETFQPDKATGFKNVLTRINPELAHAVQNGRLSGQLRGFAGIPSYLRRSHGPGWALVGDAGYFKDPITAHGITDALRDAELLSRAAVVGSDRALADYEEQRDALSIPLIEATDAIASYDWDLASVRDHHIDLNKAMKREVEHIANSAPVAPLAA